MAKEERHQQPRRKTTGKQPRNKGGKWRGSTSNSRLIESFYSLL